MINLLRLKLITFWYYRSLYRLALLSLCVYLAPLLIIANLTNSQKQVQKASRQANLKLQQLYSDLQIMNLAIADSNLQNLDHYLATSVAINAPRIPIQLTNQTGKTINLNLFQTTLLEKLALPQIKASEIALAADLAATLNCQIGQMITIYGQNYLITQIFSQPALNGQAYLLLDDKQTNIGNLKLANSRLKIAYTLNKKSVPTGNAHEFFKTRLSFDPLSLILIYIGLLALALFSLLSLQIALLKLSAYALKTRLKFGLRFRNFLLEQILENCLGLLLALLIANSILVILTRTKFVTGLAFTFIPLTYLTLFIVAIVYSWLTSIYWYRRAKC